MKLFGEVFEEETRTLCFSGQEATRNNLAVSLLYVSDGLFVGKGFLLAYTDSTFVCVLQSLNKTRHFESNMAELHKKHCGGPGQE